MEVSVDCGRVEKKSIRFALLATHFSSYHLRKATVDLRFVSAVSSQGPNKEESLDPWVLRHSTSTTAITGIVARMESFPCFHMLQERRRARREGTVRDIVQEGGFRALIQGGQGGREGQGPQRLVLATHHTFVTIFACLTFQEKQEVVVDSRIIQIKK